jgi:ribosomal protein S18 acetylase RimI-like enzyme
MGSQITLTELSPPVFRGSIDQLMGVYKAAMNPPERQLAGRETIMERHAANPDFRALAAVDPGSGAGIAGFCYGFHGLPGQWWHDIVAAALASIERAHGDGDGMAWLADSFEVAELHVMPQWQGRGIGRALLLELASSRPERTAVLSTQDAESRAKRLYRSVGFTDLITGFRFSGGDVAYAVMGAVLPLGSRSVPRSASPSAW